MTLFCETEKKTVTTDEAARICLKGKHHVHFQPGEQDHSDLIGRISKVIEGMAVGEVMHIEAVGDKVYVFSAPNVRTHLSGSHCLLIYFYDKDEEYSLREGEALRKVIAESIVSCIDHETSILRDLRLAPEMPTTGPAYKESGEVS